MTHDQDSTRRLNRPLTDEVPDADAAEQQQPVDDDTDIGGLDLGDLENIADHDANPADLIDQAIVIPLPDEPTDDD